MAELGEPLSERELDVLRCLAGGATNKDIAADLMISQNTVKVHLRNIYAKLGVSSRTEATTAGIQQGYIQLEGQMGETAVAPPPTPEISTATEETAVRQENTPAATEPDSDAQRSWRILGLAALLGISVIIIVALGLRVITTPQATPTPEPFNEQPIGDTRWSISRPLPQGRANMAVASVGLDLYQIGGETADGVDGTVQRFDSRNGYWQEAAEKPTAVADITATELYGEIYVPGGRLTDGSPTAVVEVYSPSQDAWRTVAALPQPVAGGLTLTDGAFLYLFGGWDGENYLDTAYVYDPGSDTWRPLPPMPTASAFASGGELSNQLVVVGGTDGVTDLATCQLFDPAAETWAECPDMLMPRAGAGGTVLLNKLYVIGGGTQPDAAVPFSEVYNPNNQTWQVVNTPTLNSGSNWPHVGVNHIETRIYVLGGRQGDEFSAENLVFVPVYQTFIPAAKSNDE